MVDDTVDRMGPPPRSLAAEAYDCFMVGIPTGPPNARLRREPSRPNGRLRLGSTAIRSLSSNPAPGNMKPAVPTCREGRAVLGAVKAASRRLRRWPCGPALTAPARGALPNCRSGRRDVRPAKQRDDHNAMTNLQNRPRLRSPPHSNHLTPKSPCKAQHQACLVADAMNGPPHAELVEARAADLQPFLLCPGRRLEKVVSLK